MDLIYSRVLFKEKAFNISKLNVLFNFLALKFSSIKPVHSVVGF